MLKLAALIDLFFTDDSFGQRVRKISDCGYSFVETWGGDSAGQLKEVADAGKDCGVELVSIVMNFATDEAVAPIRPASRKNFIERIDQYSDNALAAGCKQGIVTTGQSVEGCSYQQQRDSLVEALMAAGELAAKKGFSLNLEPLNTEVDHPGYFLNSPEDGVAIVKEVGLDNVKMLFDIYHMEIMRGNQTDFLVHNASYIGHIHTAGVPGRHEVFNGETNYPFVLKKLVAAGYEGYIGLEYFPELESVESLKKTREYLTGK